MAGPVDKIYVEIAAPISRLDRDMTANERRVDQGANRMAQSVRKAEKNVTSGGAMLAGRAFAGSSRFALGALGLGISGAYIGRNFESINIKLNTAVGGAMRTLGDLANGITDFDTLTRRNAGGIRKYWERQADEAYAARNGMQGPSESEAEIDRFRGLSRMGEDADRELRKAQAATDEAKKRVDLEQRISDLMRERDDLTRTNPENIRVINAAYDKRIEAARLEAAAKGDKPAADTKGRFDTIGTIFGGMRLAQRNQNQKPKASAAEEGTEKNTKAIAAGIKEVIRAINTFAVWR